MQSILNPPLPSAVAPNEKLTLPEGYYTQSRPEMMGYIPKTSKRILDVGCGIGGFGAQLKESLNAEVWGIEAVHDMAEVARKRLDQAFAGDVFQLVDGLPDKYFDCIVFNDVLEHLADPYTVLRRVKGKLTADGVIVCSIPNIRFFYTLKTFLLTKQWKYEANGIMDHTHLRFFTQGSIVDMFDELDYKILKMEGINEMGRSWKFTLLNTLFLGYFSDTKYLQYACVVAPK